MSIHTSSDTFVFHVTLEAEGDLPDDDRVAVIVSEALYRMNSQVVNVIGCALERKYTDEWFAVLENAIGDREDD